MKVRGIGSKTKRILALILTQGVEVAKKVILEEREKRDVDLSDSYFGKFCDRATGKVPRRPTKRR